MTSCRSCAWWTNYRHDFKLKFKATNGQRQWYNKNLQATVILNLMCVCSYFEGSLFFHDNKLECLGRHPTTLRFIYCRKAMGNCFPIIRVETRNPYVLGRAYKEAWGERWDVSKWEACYFVTRCRRHQHHAETHTRSHVAKWKYQNDWCFEINVTYHRVFYSIVCV